jgi:hypothetical protein
MQFGRQLFRHESRRRRGRLQACAAGAVLAVRAALGRDQVK